MSGKWTQRLALGLAATALFAAVGGPSYAAKKASQISGSKIKSKSIAGAKLKNNTVTGTQINENKLGKVPSAATAAVAATANTVANGSISLGKLDANLVTGSVAAYATIDGASPTTLSAYRKNVLSVTKTGTGRYCVNVNWAAAGRTPVQQNTPVIVSPRLISQNAAADVNSAACPNNGISVSLNDTAGATAADGKVHVIVP